MLDRIIVTGAAGFVGSHLVERLLDLGHEVIGVDSFTSYYSREHKLRNLARAAEESAFRLVDGDLLKLNLEELLQGVSGVVHQAAEPGVRVSWGDNFSRHLERTWELLGGCWKPFRSGYWNGSSLPRRPRFMDQWKRDR